MSTILWLGAHKTGTTFLQKCLDLSQPALRRHGIYYMELDEFRTKYGRPLLNRDGSSPAPNEFSPDWAEHVLVFDENIPGYVQHAVSPKGFYPAMTERADTITDFLGIRPDEIVFGIRSYDGYLPSLYCETLKSTAFKRFDEYVATAFASRLRKPADISDMSTFERLNWKRLLARLARHYPAARVRVYLHEQLRGHESELLAETIGLPADEVDLLRESERVGFSGDAVRRLHEIADERTVELRDVRRVVRKFPSGPDHPSFNPFDDAERAWFRARYAEHVEALRNDDRFDVIELG